MDLPDDFYTRLLRIRGGCRCGDPGAHPPCRPCEDPMSNEEANEILSELAVELPELLGSAGVVEVLRLQTLLIEHDYDGTIST